jgi:GNAT superfamily N-acetyltransferase
MLHVDPEDPHSPVAQDLIARLVAELSERYPEDEGEEAASFRPADAVGPRRIFVVAWFGSDAVGCGALRPLPGANPAVGELKRMYVAPASRGQGIGREILQDLESHARSFDYRRLVLETGTRQPEAVALYEHSGYAPIPKYPPYENSPRSLCFGKDLR